MSNIKFNYIVKPAIGSGCRWVVCQEDGFPIATITWPDRDFIITASDGYKDYHETSSEGMRASDVDDALKSLVEKYALSLLRSEINVRIQKEFNEKEL